MSAKKTTSIAKKIPGKRRWYFRHKNITLKTVLKNISFYPNPWYYVGKPNHRYISVSRKNVSEIIAVDRDRVSQNPFKYTKLTIVDIYILYRWLNLGLIDFSQFTGLKMYAFDCPLVKSQEEYDVSKYHYLSLEQNPDNPLYWNIHIRSRKYINKIPNPYMVLCMKSTSTN